MTTRVVIPGPNPESARSPFGLPLPPPPIPRPPAPFFRAAAFRRRLKPAATFCAAALLLILTSSPLSALDPNVPITQYVHEILTVKNGLAVDIVNDILQTKDGYLWFATSDGLQRFDGIALDTFDSENTEGMKKDNFYKLLEARDGSIWIKTKKHSLVQLHNRGFSTYTMQNGFAGRIFLPLVEYKDSSIWIAAANGLYRIKNGMYEVYTEEKGLLSNDISSIHQDKRGNLWIVSAKGINIYNESGFIPMTAAINSFSNDNTLIYEDHDSNVWIAASKGLYRFNGIDSKYYDMQYGSWVKEILLIHEDRNNTLWIITKNVVMIYKSGKFEDYMKLPWGRIVIHDSREDKDGNLWMATKSGLYRFYEGKLDKYDKKDGLSHDWIFSLYEDREGNLWIGTGKGLDCLKNASVMHLILGQENDRNYIFPLCEDANGAKLIGTMAGLLFMKNGKTVLLDRKSRLEFDIATSLQPVNDGSVWVGTRRGLKKIKNGKYEKCDACDSMNNKSIMAIYQDRKDCLWIGTLREGLFKMKQGGWTQYTRKNGLVDDTVRCIMGNNNDIYVGTDNGVCRFEQGRESDFQTLLDTRQKAITCIHRDSEGALWFGTKGSGIIRYKNGECKSIKRTDGLYNKSAFWILEDHSGFLWMSCNRGIYRASLKDLNDFCDGKRASIECVSYDEADGMPTAECNDGFSPAGWEAADGSLWFPTTKGVVVASPKRMHKNTLPPPVVVEEVIVDGKAADFKSSPRLPHGKGDLEVKYTALSFVNPKKVKFKYRLEGYDTDWVDAGTRRTAYYTNLPTGKLKFRVIACNNDGVWNREGASFGFYFKPHFHQTVLFRVFAMALALGLIFWVTRLIIRIRLKVVQAESGVLEERNRLAREIHDTLAQGLSAVAIQLEDTKEGLPPESSNLKRKLENIKRLASDCLEEARRSIWALRPQLLESKNFPEALQAIARLLIGDSRIQLHMRVEGEVRPLSAQGELNLLRIAQESVTNAMKYSRCANIFISLS